MPYDPHLDYLFWGEELLYAARLWTSGYDLFSPTVAICSHSYGREQAPNVFEDRNNRGDEWAVTQERTHEKLRYLLGWPFRNPDTQVTDAMRRARRTHGMGQRRALHEYMAAAGIDVEQQTVGSTCLGGHSNDA